MAEPIDPKEIYRDRSESNNVGQPAPTEEQNPDSIFRGQPNSSTSGTEVPHEAIAKDGEDTITATKLSFKRGRNDEELDASTAALDQSNDLSGGPPVHNDGIDDAKDTSPAVGIPSKEEGTGQESNALTIQKTTSTSAEPLFSVFSLTQRRLLVWVTALAGFIVSLLNLMTDIQLTLMCCRVPCQRQSIILRSMSSPEIFIRRRH